MTARESRVRRPYSSPCHPDDPISLTLPVKKIRFLHPGYPENSNILLQLPALDPGGCIHYDCAHEACSMVANNRWDGFFSIDKDGQQRVRRESLADDSLHEDEYYFHLPKLNSTNGAVDKDYSVIPSFADWPFPHRNMPARWAALVDRRLDSAGPPLSTDLCCMTKSSLSVEDAHIIPINPVDQAWFDSNVMGQYAGANSPPNILRLKVDVHQVFDRKPRFAIVPRDGQMVGYFFTADDSKEAIELYHTVPFQPLNGKEVRFLLARMAWTIFFHLDLFLRARVRRKLVRLVNRQQIVQDVDGNMCDQIYRGGRSRSASPRKRPASQMRAEEPEFAEEADAYSMNQDQTFATWTRGRKRRRSSSEHSGTQENVDSRAGSHFWRVDGLHDVPVAVTSTVPQT